ncbi:GNAT family N-acetyltransferase [Streptomyces sp. NPDC051582]|uniref:GNAT family N-acetyltransferase n=1 Tax=Streptomyces sp. NPDC051582 TaxID=3155167 RepID=UPI00341BD603
MTTVVTYAQAELPARLAAQVAALEAQAWPGAGAGHDPALAPEVMLLLDDEGTVLVSLALLHKKIRHDGRTYRAAGLSSVVTRDTARGQGYGGHLVAAARTALAADPAVDLVLFSCDRPLVPFYEAAGFTRLPRAVLIGGTPGQPLATDAPGFAKEVLADFPGADTGAAAFAGARIALYPGLVDRLW